MPVAEVSLSGWVNGINNLSPANRLPEGFVRDLMNLDPVGGNFEMRTGYEKVVAGTACRAVMSLGERVLFVDGTDLFELDLSTNATRVLRTVAGAGPVASCTHAGELFISTANETLRYDGQTLREWGVPDVSGQPLVSISARKPGRRLYAMTYTNQYGEEGGTVSAANVPEGVYEFTIPPLAAGLKANLYVSSLNGRTLYLQGAYETAGPVVVNRPVDDTRSLATMHMYKPLPGAHLASWRGALLIAYGGVLQVTHPLSPHLVSRDTAFFQYPRDIEMLLAGERAVYLSADKVYQLTDPDTAEPKQSTVTDYPAVAGTGTILPDGRAVWLTRYGMSVESPDPREGIVQPNRQTFAPEEAGRGASGVVDNNGNEMVVTTLRDSGGANTLVAQDYFEAEVIRP
jgi:hypothetical protein